MVADGIKLMLCRWRQLLGGLHTEAALPVVGSLTRLSTLGAISM